MSLDWETFKSASGLSNSKIAYIDDEGSKVLIGSECEFQEALRLARLNKNRLKLIIYDDMVPPQEKVNVGLGLNAMSPTDWLKKNNATAVPHNSSLEETICQCQRDAAPEWFIRYMKKFGNELIYELKSHISNIVHSALENERKLSSSKFETAELFCEKNENSFSPVGTQTKKKKKSLERDSADLIDQREMKLMKKIEKLHATKSERLEKLDNKMRMLLEEKRRLLERKRYSKSKLDKNSLTTSEKKNFVKKALLSQNDICLVLSPGAKFAVTLNVVNDGKVSWSAPQLQCYDYKGLILKESEIKLPSLLPSESCAATLMGHVLKCGGVHYVKCKVTDGPECCGPEFTCWIEVELPESPQNDLIDSLDAKDSVDVGAQPQDREEVLVDFEKEVICSSQKIIENNISEIEKRLQDIDLLMPSTSGEASDLKKHTGKGKKLSKKTSDFHRGCDLLQDLEGKESSPREEWLFGNEIPPSEVWDLKVVSQKSQMEEGSANKLEKDGELESCSDSEMSLILFDEEPDEEANFIVVPSKSPSLAESASEDGKSPVTESRDKATTTSEEPGSVAPKAGGDGPTQGIQKNESNFHSSQSSPTRSRRSPFGEEISKPKKMKSKSTEYRFTAANLTQPTFTQIPDGFSGGRPPKFTFTGETSGGKGEGVPEGRPAAHSGETRNFNFTIGKEPKLKAQYGKWCVPKTDASGKVIYAVNTSGMCIPVARLFRSDQKNETDQRSPEGSSKGEPQGKGKRSVNNSGAVNILPNVLVNGASNVASLAFNTAKSVINNLQSAFVPGGKTELGQPAYETESKDMVEAMFLLYEMGFLDFQLNRELLLLYGNDLTKVVEELVRAPEKSSERPQ